MAIKAIIIRPFTGTLSLPEGFDLDYPRDETEPVGGGFVAVVEGIGGYGMAIIKTSPEKVATLAADPDTLAILPLTEPEDGDKWPELDGDITDGGLARINAILSAIGAGQLPAGISVRAALGAIAPGVEWSGFEIG